MEEKTLYIIPTCISDFENNNFTTEYVKKCTYGLQQFIVEDIKTSRRFLKKMGHPIPVENLNFKELNEHTKDSEIQDLVLFIKNSDTGLLSEAGAPGVADPGSEIVLLAHQNNIKVVPLVGPSSILLALMASGLNGQSFAFCGYLPIKNENRKEKLRLLETRSKIENQTQIFIETPYRNMTLLNEILKYCKNSTYLTIAANITGKTEFIKTKTIEQWKNNIPAINKIPTVFIMQSK